jgi:hypothetical protein
MKADLVVHSTRLAAESGSGGVGLNLLLTLAVMLLVAAAGGGLRVAWRRRAEQQEEDLHELPYPPEHPGTVLAAPLRGMYLGTVDAGHWLEWIAGRGRGNRGADYITVYEAGVQVDRAGTAFWIPREAVRGARLERAHAGKVVGPGRLVVVAWSFGDHELETGFRAEDRSRQPKVVRSVHDLIGPAPAYPADGELTRPHALPRTRLRSRPPAGADGSPEPAATGPTPTGAPAGDPTTPAMPHFATAPIPVVAHPAPGVTTAPFPPSATQPLPLLAPPEGRPQSSPASPVPGTATGGRPGMDGPPAHPEVDPLTSPLGEVVRRARRLREGR